MKEKLDLKTAVIVGLCIVSAAVLLIVSASYGIEILKNMGQAIS